MVEIALFRGRTLQSKIIRFFTRSCYSHCAFLIDGKACIEIWDNTGVNYNTSISAQHEPGTKVDIFRFDPPLVKWQEEELIARLNFDSVKDIKYDYLMALRFVPFMRGVFHLLDFRDVRSKPKFFCSEYVVERLLSVAYFLFYHTNANEVPPDWLARSVRLSFNRSEVTK
jgi:hypothetical protein